MIPARYFNPEGAIKVNELDQDEVVTKVLSEIQEEEEQQQHFITLQLPLNPLASQVAVLIEASLKIHA